MIQEDYKDDIVFSCRNEFKYFLSYEDSLKRLSKIDFSNENWFCIVYNLTFLAAYHSNIRKTYSKSKNMIFNYNVYWNRTFASELWTVHRIYNATYRWLASIVIFVKSKLFRDRLANSISNLFKCKTNASRSGGGGEEIRAFRRNSLEQRPLQCTHNNAFTRLRRFARRF